MRSNMTVMKTMDEVSEVGRKRTGNEISGKVFVCLDNIDTDQVRGSRWEVEPLWWSSGDVFTCVVAAPSAPSTEAQCPHLPGRLFRRST